MLPDEFVCLGVPCAVAESQHFSPLMHRSSSSKFPRPGMEIRAGTWYTIGEENACSGKSCAGSKAEALVRRKDLDLIGWHVSISTIFGLPSMVAPARLVELLRLENPDMCSLRVSPNRSCDQPTEKWKLGRRTINL